MNEIMAIAFDKDGTLFNTEEIYEQAFNEAITRSGAKIAANTRELMVGLSADKTRELLQEVLKNQMDADDFINLWLQIFDEKVEAGEISLMPEAESILETLSQNYPLALVTSDDMERTLQTFNATRPDLFKLFSVIITVETVQKAKPDPEPYLMAANLLGVKNENLLVIEDSFLGVSAALASASQVLIYAPKQEPEPKIAKNAKAVIKNHGEILRYLN